jgi:hypothetical protein
VLQAEETANAVETYFIESARRHALLGVREDFLPAIAFSEDKDTVVKTADLEVRVEHAARTETPKARAKLTRLSSIAETAEKYLLAEHGRFQTKDEAGQDVRVRGFKFPPLPTLREHLKDKFGIEVPDAETDTDKNTA